MIPLFEDVLVVGLQPAVSSTSRPASFAPRVLYHFKADADASAIVEFCFPDLSDVAVSESFTFTLTQQDSTRIFGFCRRLVRPSQPLDLIVKAFLQ